MKASPFGLRMRWLGLLCCVVLMLLLATPSTAPAATIYDTPLTGANEVPPNASTATGFATVTLNGNTLAVFVSFTGLTNIAAAAHIHCCVPAGVNGIVAVPFVGFPAATSGTYSNSFDLTLDATYNSAFETASGGTAASAEAALIAGLNAGQAYANIHDSPNFPGGEIRGQLSQHLSQRVPGPPTATLLLLGVTTLIAVVRRRVHPLR